MAISATYVSAASFTVAGDRVEEFAPGVRVRADCGVDGVKHGVVESAVYADPSTAVTISGDALTANLAGVLHGNDTPDSLSNHAANHAAAGRDPLTPEAIGAAPSDHGHDLVTEMHRQYVDADIVLVEPSWLFLNPTNNAIQVTLPPNPSPMSRCRFTDLAQMADVNNITIITSDGNAVGGMSSYVIRTYGENVEFVFVSYVNDWVMCARDTRQLLVSANDAAQGFLADKIAAGSGISVSVLNDGGNESVSISAVAATADVPGVVELATIEETGARGDGGRAVTPAGLASFALVKDVRITGDHVAATNTRIRGYLSAASWITLPAFPADGDTVEYVDAGRNAATCNVTVQRNGKTIHGLSEDLAIDIDGLRAFFQYDATAGDWVMTLSKVGG